LVQLVNTPASSIVRGHSWKLALLHATTAGQKGKQQQHAPEAEEIRTSLIEECIIGFANRTLLPP
jgi:hypothetical protein